MTCRGRNMQEEHHKITNGYLWLYGELVGFNVYRQSTARNVDNIKIDRSICYNKWLLHS
jgi:hypothetical protein